MKRQGKRERREQSLFRPLHEVIITKTLLITIGSVIDLVIPVRIERDLGLSSLGLLVALIRRTLLTHLLIASRS